jgi:hypothetical protein
MAAIRVRAWLVLSLMAVPGTAVAQVGGGQITGVVTDASGATTAGATVTVANVATGSTRSTASNVAGAYTLPALPPGVYTVDIVLSGFRAVRQEQVRVETGVPLRHAAPEPRRRSRTARR